MDCCNFGHMTYGRLFIHHIWILQVRTRAVSLPYYTCSSEDILKHAKKLLKSELPVSLRLMGRMDK